MSAPWERVEQIFHAALDLPNEKRDDFLEEACAGDAALAAEIKSMLRAHTTAAELLEQPALELHAEIFAEEEGALRSGRPLGVYQSGARHGRGGVRRRDPGSLDLLTGERKTDPVGKAGRRPGDGGKENPRRASERIAHALQRTPLAPHRPNEKAQDRRLSLGAAQRAG